MDKVELTVADLNFEQRVIQLRAIKAKTNRKREIPMTVRVQGELQGLASGKQATDFVFGGIQDFKRRFGTLKRTAGVNGLNFHDFRHAFVLRSILAGIPQVIVFKASGQASEEWKRYDYFFVPSEASGRAWNIKGSLFPLPQVQFTRRGEALMSRDLNNLAPRFGFAWTIAKGWVARGGYGIFYAPQQASAGVTMSGNGRPPVIAASEVQLAYTQPNVDYTQADGILKFPNTTVNARFPVFTPSFWDPNYHESYAQQWNLTIEHEVFKDTVARVGYVGSKNTKVQGALNFNLLRPLQGNTREDPRFTAVELYGPYFSGVYHALQTALSRRLSCGLAIEANYPGRIRLITSAAFSV